jgi:DNA adenine methylase
MLECKFCGFPQCEEEDEIEIDMYKQGYWCPHCDGYNYFSEDETTHRFTLILEDKSSPKTPFNVPEVKFAKRLSPYRYPGGKSKVIDYLYSHLRESKSKKLVSPFTGGGSFELAMLNSGVIEELHLNDLDTGVYSLWWIIKHMPYELISRIEYFDPNHKEFFKAQQVIKEDYKSVNIIEAAWTSLLVNRLAYSGVAKANPLGGRNGTKKSLLSRWNPADLISRIEKVHTMSECITITQENAIELIEESYWDEESTIFIDPPYVAKGKDLYHCFYTHKDHLELSCLLDSLHMGFPGADMVVTYDFCELLDQIYTSPKREVIGRVYSA